MADPGILRSVAKRRKFKRLVAREAAWETDPHAHI